jgi:hypothetical protein
MPFKRILKLAKSLPNLRKKKQNTAIVSHPSDKHEDSPKNTIPMLQLNGIPIDTGTLEKLQKPLDQPYFLQYNYQDTYHTPLPQLFPNLFFTND